MNEEELKQISDGIFNKLDEKEKVFLATVHDVKNKEIERLKNTIKELSKDVDMWNKKYNEQFNIINELEKELEYEKNMYKENLDIETTDTVKEFLRGNAWLADDMLNRLKELKEGR